MEIERYIPLNWEIAKNPLNWIIVATMIIFTLYASELVFHFPPPTQG